jgi:hypothetical protein
VLSSTYKIIKSNKLSLFNFDSYPWR